jgi:hypothetical protein
MLRRSPYDCAIQAEVFEPCCSPMPIWAAGSFDLYTFTTKYRLHPYISKESDGILQRLYKTVHISGRVVKIWARTN